jgi:NAD(P)H-hydrate repair Nnr-like enzyme with NAD(P)H-hydrate dehydratase domain
VPIGVPELIILLTFIGLYVAIPIGLAKWAATGGTGRILIGVVVTIVAWSLPIYLIALVYNRRGAAAIARRPDL